MGNVNIRREKEWGGDKVINGKYPLEIDWNSQSEKRRMRERERERERDDDDDDERILKAKTNGGVLK